jgi:hypothetical protein
MSRLLDQAGPYALANCNNPSALEGRNEGSRAIRSLEMTR